MLRRFLTERGFSVVCLNGSMDMEERKRVQEAFAKETSILISTDAGGEGLNSLLDLGALGEHTVTRNKRTDIFLSNFFN
jgi:hypothetical protein